MPFSVALIRQLEKVDPQLREVLYAILEEIERQRAQLEDQVTKKEFNELKEIVRDLAEAQKQAGERLDRLEKVVEELAEAQKRTEEALNELAEAQKRTEERVNELAETQKRSEERLDRLEKVVKELAEAQKRTEERLNELAEAQKRTEIRLNELAEAQKRTEERLNELAEAQKRTEIRLNELAEAQKRTEEELRKLIGEHRKTREQLGGLSHTVGYILEDRAYKGLPPLLEKDFNLKLTQPLKRDFIEIAPGRFEEINILGPGQINGRKVWIVGEAKTQLKKRDIDAFLRKLQKIADLLPGEKIPILVTYQTSPLVREYAQKKGVKLYFSYEFPL